MDGQRCASITKSMLNVRDGRLSITPEGILLFASPISSSSSSSGSSGDLNQMRVKVRFAEFLCYEMTSKEVQTARHENQVFSLWKKRQEEEDKRRTAKLSLRAIDDEVNYLINLLISLLITHLLTLDNPFLCSLLTL